MSSNPRLIDLTGKTFGHWFVIEKSGNTKGGGALWRCKCLCGSLRNVVGGDLRSGKSVSCGCKGSRSTIGIRSATHRMKGTKIHTCWSNMLQRCRDKTNKNYGGKGISVCDEWLKFENFHSWAKSSGYQDELTIERINNSLGYNPDNCTWATRKQQSRNRTIVNMAGPNKSFAEVAEENGVSTSVMNNRVSAGKWSHEKAATTKVGSKKRNLQKDELGRFIKSDNPWRR